eukprot:IDg21730t1
MIFGPVVAQAVEESKVIGNRPVESRKKVPASPAVSVVQLAGVEAYSLPDVTHVIVPVRNKDPGPRVEAQLPTSDAQCSERSSHSRYNREEKRYKRRSAYAARRNPSAETKTFSVTMNAQSTRLGRKSLVGQNVAKGSLPWAIGQNRKIPPATTPEPAEHAGTQQPPIANLAPRDASTRSSESCAQTAAAIDDAGTSDHRSFPSESTRAPNESVR